MVLSESLCAKSTGFHNMSYACCNTRLSRRDRLSRVERTRVIVLLRRVEVGTTGSRQHDVAPAYSPAMELVPFDPAFAETVSDWARSAGEAEAWCSRTDVPVPAAVITGWSSDPDVTAFQLWDQSSFVGYGEIWTDDDEKEVELARLIVEPEQRGRGVGRRMVALLLAHARVIYPTVVVRVHPDNSAAQRCYAAGGFTRVDPADEDQWNAGQPMAYVWMLADPPA